MGQRELHQVIVGAGPGDAITDQTLLIRHWLRELGYVSDIFAYHIHEAMAGEVRPIASYRPGRDQKWLVLHHSIGSTIVDDLIKDGRQEFILIYHNITPPEFFRQVDPAWAHMMQQGQEQLLALPSRTGLALADSAYNELDLQTAGFRETGVLPITLDESQYQWALNEALANKYSGQGPLLLFVGRIAPNKRQEDLVKLLYYYRRIEPQARLVLVGDKWLLGYDRWLQSLAHSLGLAEAVILTGQVSQQDMVTFYRTADLYVSMSTHEGFGKPLIESMYLGLPVLAYCSTAVPYTLGQAGVMFKEKNFEALAEVVNILIRDRPLRQRLIARQHERVQRFLEPQVKRQLHDYLNKLGLL